MHLADRTTAVEAVEAMDQAVVSAVKMVAEEVAEEAGITIP